MAGTKESDREKRLEASGLPEGYREVFEVVLKVAGYEAAEKVLAGIADLFSGQQVYFTKREKLFAPNRDAEIRAKFTGCNVKQLAKEYGLSCSWVREILRDKRKRLNAQI